MPRTDLTDIAVLHKTYADGLKSAAWTWGIDPTSPTGTDLTPLPLSLEGKCIWVTCLGKPA